MSNSKCCILYNSFIILIRTILNSECCIRDVPYACYGPIVCVSLFYVVAKLDSLCMLILCFGWMSPMTMRDSVIIWNNSLSTFGPHEIVQLLHVLCCLECILPHT